MFWHLSRRWWTTRIKHCSSKRLDGLKTWTNYIKLTHYSTSLIKRSIARGPHFSGLQFARWSVRRSALYHSPSICQCRSVLNVNNEPSVMTHWAIKSLIHEIIHKCFKIFSRYYVNSDRLVNVKSIMKQKKRYISLSNNCSHLDRKLGSLFVKRRV